MFPLIPISPNFFRIPTKSFFGFCQKKLFSRKKWLKLRVAFMSKVTFSIVWNFHQRFKKHRNIIPVLIFDFILTKAGHVILRPPAVPPPPPNL